MKIKKQTYHFFQHRIGRCIDNGARFADCEYNQEKHFQSRACLTKISDKNCKDRLKPTVVEIVTYKEVEAAKTHHSRQGPPCHITCLNNGTCNPKNNTCTCQQGYSGAKCQTGQLSHNGKLRSIMLFIEEGLRSSHHRELWSVTKPPKVPYEVLLYFTIDEP